MSYPRAKLIESPVLQRLTHQPLFSLMWSYLSKVKPALCTFTHLAPSSGLCCSESSSQQLQQESYRVQVEQFYWSLICILPEDQPPQPVSLRLSVISLYVIGKTKVKHERATWLRFSNHYFTCNSSQRKQSLCKVQSSFFLILKNIAVFKPAV